MDYAENFRHEVCRREIIIKKETILGPHLPNESIKKTTLHEYITHHVEQQFWDVGITWLEGSMPAVK